jgi:hypothetical protein
MKIPKTIILLALFLISQAQAGLIYVESYSCTAVKEKGIFGDNFLYNQETVIVKLAGKNTYMTKDNLIVNDIEYNREGQETFGNKNTRVKASWNMMEEDGMVIFKKGFLVDSTTIYSCIIWKTIEK